MDNSKQLNILGVGAQYGALAGLGCIVLTLVLYLINIELVLGFWIFIGYAVIVLFKVITAITIKNAQNDYISFKDAVRSTFMVSVVGLLIWNVFNAVLFSYIDPELIALSRDKAVERTAKVMEIAGASQDEIEEAVDKVEEQDFSPTIGKSAMNYALSCIIGFIYSLGIAGLFYMITKDNASVDNELEDGKTID